MIILKLGNAQPRVKRKLPVPREIQTLDQLCEYATQERGFDPTLVDRIIGRDESGETTNPSAFEALEAHCLERLAEVGEWTGPETETVIQVSPDTARELQAGDAKAFLHEVPKVWWASAREKPTWIMGNDQQAAVLAAASLGVSDIRDWEE